MLEFVLRSGRTLSQKADRWGPPLKLSFLAQSQNFGGIVNSVAFMNFDEDTEVISGSEVCHIPSKAFLRSLTKREMHFVTCIMQIDLEIVPGEFHVPIWVDDPNRVTPLQVIPGVDIEEIVNPEGVKVGRESSKRSAMAT